MSSHRLLEDRISENSYRPLSTQIRGNRDGAMYDDRRSRSDSRDRYPQNPSAPRRHTPPQDVSRMPPRGPMGNTNSGHEREWDRRRDSDMQREYDDGHRGRHPSPPREGRGGYRDRDREGYRSPRYSSRSRSRSPNNRRNRSPYYGGPPSREVILEGLPLEMTENDIAKELKQYHDVEELEDVRVIRDRKTLISRQFGFLRFSTLQKSRAFLERNYPTIHLYGSNSGEGDDQGAKVRIAFSRERDDRDRVERTDGEWKCKICTLLNFPHRTQCFRCQAPKNILPVMDQMTPGKPPEFANNGDSDASPDNTPSQFLLLRGLEPTVTEDLLAKGAAKLYKSSGGSPPPTAATSKKPTAKVASTTSDSNLGAKEGSLKRVLLVRDRKSGENWRYGFAEFAGVEDAQAALTKFNSLEKFTIASKPVNASYVHAGVFVPMLNYSPEYEQYTFSPLTNPAIKLAYWDEEAYVSELVVSRDTPETIDNPSINSRVAADKAAAAAEKEGLLKPGKAMEVKAKKRKAEIDAIATSKKAVPAHLEFWRNRHAELHGGVAEGVEDNTSSQTAALSKKKSKTQTKDEASPPSQSFADLERKCCYLCSRQFKTESEVNKHERLSQLHRDNLKNEDFKTKALAKIAKAGAAAEDTPEYRDRARERRAAFKQPKKPTPGSSKSTTGPAAITEEEAAEEPIAPSKGAALLGKMGWAAGEGLGAKGTGMVAPIATEMYIQGVGLGAQGGKVGDAVDEAARLTKGGYGGFLERTRDRAKERFEGMG